MTTGLNSLIDGDHDVPGSLSAADAVTQASLGSDDVADATESAHADSWRSEVAARLERYRTRRKPRSPRYPSLLLPFDAPESWSRPSPSTITGMVATAPLQNAGDIDYQPDESPAEVVAEAERGIQPGFTSLRRAAEQNAAPEPYRLTEPAPEQSAKVIEFPRSAAIPVFRPSDLADPVFDFQRPRIVEAPEILPPPPALGGMLIEPAHRELADRHDGMVSPSGSAPVAHRMLGALIDGAILGTALTAFAVIFLRLNPGFLGLIHGLQAIRTLLPVLAVGAGGIAIALWAAYQFFFVVYTGSTPGLRCARLRLVAFDGSPLNRRSRRWRVLASFLSAISAGLGYLWCVLDQDGLCWHDRITHTHLQKAAPRTPDSK